MSTATECTAYHLFSVLCHEPCHESSQFKSCHVMSCHVMSCPSLYGCLFWLAVCMRKVPKIMIPYRILSHNPRQQRTKRAAMQMVNLIEGCGGAGKGT